MSCESANVNAQALKCRATQFVKHKISPNVSAGQRFGIFHAPSRVFSSLTPWLLFPLEAPVMSSDWSITCSRELESKRGHLSTRATQASLLCILLHPSYWQPCGHKAPHGWITDSSVGAWVSICLSVGVRVRTRASTNASIRRGESRDWLQQKERADSSHQLNAWDVSFIALSFHSRLQTRADCSSV